MLVYGDQRERVRSRDRFGELEGERERLNALPPGVERHAALVGLFIDIGGLTQGVADELFRVDQQDGAWSVVEGLMVGLIRLGRAVIRSWESGYHSPGLEPLTCPAGLPEEVEIKLPEGHAFYALYPEAYALAARRLELVGPPLVIGLRSIGVGLAAIVAAALGLEKAVTVRPSGDPFARKVSISNELASWLLAGVNTHYVIVDEGPGLSGSSFGGIADWLENAGVDRQRISFLPGHSGLLGPEASDAHRQRWQAAQRPVVSSDELLGERLAEWLSTLVGPLNGALDDVSGGAWRKLRYERESDWPAVQPSFERRKLIARSRGRSFLLKFTGLGRIGIAKFDLARSLQPFVPEPVGLLHGWLVEQWHDDATPATPSETELREYLKRRSALAGAAGASIELLQTMIERNLPCRAPAMDCARLQQLVRPVKIDGRLAAHEWLRLPWGRLRKTDALDHHAAHDLIGCQDIAWDVAGAEVELGLRVVLPVDPELLAFYRTAYLAFQVGLHRMAAAGLAGWPAEQARNLAAAERYAALAARP